MFQKIRRMICFLSICCNYLEVSRDLLQTMPIGKRIQTSALWKLNNARNLLETIPCTSPSDRMLAQLIAVNLDWLTGKRVAFEEIKNLYQNCSISAYQTAAWAVVTIMLQMSFFEGLNFSRILHRDFRKSGI